ncbi:MAG TPA: hypothetical protein VF155_11590 [Candidatus Dormibacteraeota bacterium]
MTEAGGGEGELSPSERARQRRRDRKRQTRMVIDNAGLRRVLAAVRMRDAKRKGRSGDTPDPPEPPA